MAKSDASPKYTAKLPRTGHSLSHRLDFTSTTGYILPFFHDLAQPNDKYDFSVGVELSRSLPILAPSRPDINIRCDLFFVPMQLLYEPFGSTFYNINDNFSSNIDASNTNIANGNFPVLDYRKLMHAIKVKEKGDETPLLYKQLHSEAFRLLDMLGFNVHALTQSTTLDYANGYTPNVFPYQLLAYHAIYQYYFRLDDKERFNQYAFNWDAFSNRSVVDDTVYSDYAGLKTILGLHRIPFDFDYFTSIRKDPIVSKLNSFTSESFTNLVDYNDYLTSVAFSPIVSDGGLFVGDEPVTGLGSSNDVTNSEASLFGLNTAFLRQMFANEKLLQVTARARKHYDDQTLAHFGVKVPHDVKHDITHIGTRYLKYDFVDVTAMAGTQDVALGEMNGKGFASGKLDFGKFTAPVHGVIMATVTYVPKVSYVAPFLRKNAITNRLDLPIPEFDALGMQPTYRYEVNDGYYNPGGGYISTSNQSATDIVGWNYRYSQFKTAFNRVSYAFARPYSFISENNTKVNNLSAWVLNQAPLVPTGEAYTPSELRYDSTSLVPYMTTPNMLDFLVGVPFVDQWQSNEDGENWYSTPWLVYARDPFINTFRIHCIKTSWMSKYSLPKFD